MLHDDETMIWTGAIDDANKSWRERILAGLTREERRRFVVESASRERHFGRTTNRRTDGQSHAVQRPRATLALRDARILRLELREREREKNRGKPREGEVDKAEQRDPAWSRACPETITRNSVTVSPRPRADPSSVDTCGRMPRPSLSRARRSRWRTAERILEQDFLQDRGLILKRRGNFRARTQRIINARFTAAVINYMNKRLTKTGRYY